MRSLALGRGEAAVAQRHVDVVEQVQVGDQVEALEDEAELLVAQARARVVVHALRRSTPSSRYSPPVNSSSRPAMLRNVVLPEPEGPVTVTNSPSLTWMSKPRSAWVSIMWVRYTLLRFCHAQHGHVLSVTWFIRLIVDRTRVGVLEARRCRRSTTWSPGFRPSTISTADTLVAPSCDRPRAPRCRPRRRRRSGRLRSRRTGRAAPSARSASPRSAGAPRRAGSGAGPRGCAPAKRTRASTWFFTTSGDSADSLPVALPSPAGRSRRSCRGRGRSA